MNVKPHIRQYIQQSLGSDIVPLRRGRTLTYLIIPHLRLEPGTDEEEQAVQEGYEQIKIELPDLRKVCEASTNRVYYCETLYRDCITPDGEAKVRSFLSNAFKHSFRIFMDGWIERQAKEHQENNRSEDERLEVKSGVVTFLMNYHIDIDEKLITSLTRDWYRHRDENEQYEFSPLIY